MAQAHMTEAQARMTEAQSSSYGAREPEIEGVALVAHNGLAVEMMRPESLSGE